MPMQLLNIALIENDLRLDSQMPCGELKWLEDSCRNTEDFWWSLKRTFDSLFSMQSTTFLFNRYNFYHDIILRHRDNAFPAMRWYDSASGFMEISYRELGNLAAAKADAWAIYGLKAGETICIIRSMGIELAVDLLAALKIGCAASFLLPQGKSFLKKRLDALKPEHIVIDKKHLFLVSGRSEIMLPENLPKKTADFDQEHFFAYPSEQTIFRCFDPCGSAVKQEPIDITSDAAYLCAMRDGIIALGLGPGQVYGAPGFHVVETMPFLLLAGFLCGATYLHLLPEQIAEKPEIVNQQVIKAFGVSKKVRDILLENLIDTENLWECWFKNPAESVDMEQWQMFIRKLKLEKSYAFNLKWDSATGGCSLFSIRRKGMTHLNVLPLPGSSWALGDLGGGDFEPPGDVGIYQIGPPAAHENEKKATSCIIAKKGREWIFAGINTRNREGRSFPGDEILETLKNLETHHSFFCSFAYVPLIDITKGGLIVLLVFTEQEFGSKKILLSDKIRTVIAEEMGDDFQPDKIEFFSFYPRFISNTDVDHVWCNSQYLTGALFRRSRGEIFALISQLKGCILRAGAGVGL